MRSDLRDENGTVGPCLQIWLETARQTFRRGPVWCMISATHSNPPRPVQPSVGLVYPGWHAVSVHERASRDMSSACQRPTAVQRVSRSVNRAAMTSAGPPTKGCRHSVGCVGAGDCQMAVNRILRRELGLGVSLNSQNTVTVTVTQWRNDTEVDVLLCVQR